MTSQSELTHTSLRAQENGRQTKMAKVAVSVVRVFFMFGLYFSPCLQLRMMTGGISRMNKTDTPDVMEGVSRYLKSINERLPAFDYKAECDKLEVSSQVVQGTMYRVALEIVPVEKDAIHSDCIHGSDNVRLDKGDVKFVCLEIWSRPWLEPPEMLIVKRVDEPRKRNDVKSCLEAKKKP